MSGTQEISLNDRSKILTQILRLYQNMNKPLFAFAIDAIGKWSDKDPLDQAVRQKCPLS